MQQYLHQRGWQLEKVVEGRRLPWQEGEHLVLPIYGIWCWKERHDPACIELLLNEIDAEQFRYRRDPSVMLPRGRVVIRTSSEIPVLAPEVVLLYKSRAREENEEDFRSTVGALSEG